MVTVLREIQQIIMQVPTLCRFTMSDSWSIFQPLKNTKKAVSNTENGFLTLVLQSKKPKLLSAPTWARTRDQKIMSLLL
jgi:hypothetical protein